jgi:cell division protein FtsW
MVGSASGYVAMFYWNSPSALFGKQLLHFAVGLCALFIAMKFPYRLLASRRLIWVLFGGCLASLILVFFMPAAGGAHRWILIGPLRVQPSEFTKLFVCLFMASTLTYKGNRVNDLLRVPVPALAVVGTLAMLIVAEPDLGTAVILVVVAAVMLFVAGLRWRYLAVLAALGTVGMVISVLIQPYRWTRIVDFIFAVLGIREPSYQVLQSLIALGSGGLTGVGVGLGKQQAFFVPAAHTDFIYAILGEELGLAGTSAVVIGFLLIFWRGTRTARRTREPFGSYLALGITCWLVFQALTHILVCLGLVPTTGLPLPFISYGGSSLVASMAAMGLLLNISKDCNLRSSVPVRHPPMVTRHREGFARR